MTYLERASASAGSSTAPAYTHNHCARSVQGFVGGGNYTARRSHQAGKRGDASSTLARSGYQGPGQTHSIERPHDQDQIRGFGPSICFAIYMAVHMSLQTSLKPTKLFACLSDGTRLRLLALLSADDELCVCELVYALADIQPKVSHHLAMLRQCPIGQHGVRWRERLAAIAGLASGNSRANAFGQEGYGW